MGEGEDDRRGRGNYKKREATAATASLFVDLKNVVYLMTVDTAPAGLMSTLFKAPSTSGKSPAP